MSVTLLIAALVTVLLLYLLLFEYDGAPRWRRKDISRQVVVITGGGMGIGRKIALRLARLKATIVVLDIRQTLIDQVVEDIRKEYSTRAFGYWCDVSNRAKVREVIATIENEVGPVDILINNAGIVTGKLFLESADEELQRTIDVNALAHFWTCRAVLPGMIKRKRGHIVTISSLAGTMGVAHLVDYCTSKFAAFGFAESLRLELRKLGVHKYIKTTLVCPWHVTTGMFAGITHGLARVIPSLTDEDVAVAVCEAIQNEREFVIVPSWMRPAPFLIRLLPLWIADAIMTHAGAHAMDTFRGHGKDWIKYDVEMKKLAEARREGDMGSN